MRFQPTKLQRETGRIVSYGTTLDLMAHNVDIGNDVFVRDYPFEDWCEDCGGNLIDIDRSETQCALCWHESQLSWADIYRGDR